MGRGPNTAPKHPSQCIFCASGVNIPIHSTHFSFLSDVHQLHLNLLSSDFKAIHFLDSLLSALNIHILDEGIAFAFACLRVTMDIYILDFSKRVKKLLQL